MKTITSCDDESLKEYTRNSLFLGGPTARPLEWWDKNEPSWRAKACTILGKLDFDGIVCIPEPFANKYMKQVEWERACLTNCAVIAFWVPRDIKGDMLGLTTNVELGYWLAKDPMKVVYGRPDGADHTRHLDWLWSKEQYNWRPHHNDLEATLKEAMDLIKSFARTLPVGTGR